MTLTIGENAYIDVLPEGVWRDSGVAVTRGERYNLTASGRWRMLNRYNYTGPDGTGMYGTFARDWPPWNQWRIVQNAPQSALVAKVHNPPLDGEPFYVGSSTEIEVDRHGVLFFHGNMPDERLYGQDNNGKMDVKITRLKSRGADVVAGAGALTSAESVSLPPRTFPRRNIAVAPLEALGFAQSETLTLTESLRVTLVNSDYFNVVTRSDMEKILKEQAFQRTSSCSDTQCLIEMGKILAVEKIVGGTVGRVGDTFSVTVRMIDVESGKIDHSVLKNISGREDRLLDAVTILGRELAVKYAVSKKE